MKRLTFAAAVMAMILALGLDPVAAGGRGSFGGAKGGGIPSFGGNRGGSFPSFGGNRSNGFSGGRSPSFTPPKFNGPKFNSPGTGLRQPPRPNTFTPPKIVAPNFNAKVNKPTIVPMKAPVKAPMLPRTLELGKTVPGSNGTRFGSGNSGRTPNVTVRGQSPETKPVLTLKSMGAIGSRASQQAPDEQFDTAQKAKVPVRPTVSRGPQPTPPTSKFPSAPSVTVVPPRKLDRDGRRPEGIRKPSVGTAIPGLINEVASSLARDRNQRPRGSKAPTALVGPSLTAPPSAVSGFDSPSVSGTAVPTPVTAVPAVNNSVAVPPNVVAVSRPRPAVNQTVTAVTTFNRASLSLTDTDIQSAKDTLDASFKKDFEDLRQAEQKKLDNAIDVLLNNPPAGLTQAQKEALNEAVKNNDAAAVQQILAAANVDPRYGELLAPLVDSRKQLGNLAEVVSQGGSADEFAAASDAYQKSSAAFVDAAVAGGFITPAEGDNRLAGLSTELNDLSAAKSASEVLAAVVNGTLPAGPSITPLPAGDVMAAWVPFLPEGQVMAVDGDMMLVGTGAGGECTAGYVSPAECGIPVQDGDAVADAIDSEPSVVLLSLPATSEMAFHYRLNDLPYSMNPGFEQKLQNEPWIITFDRGRDFGEARYTLSQGHYEAVRTDHGWDIFKKQTTVTLDNSANPNDFQLLVDGQPQTVGASTTVEIQSEMPITVEFDDGRGHVEQKRLTTGEYAIGVDPRAATLDLYAVRADRDEVGNQSPLITDPGFKAEMMRTATPLKAERKSETSTSQVKTQRTVRPPKRLAGR